MASVTTVTPHPLKDPSSPSSTHTHPIYDLRNEARSILGSYQPVDVNDDTENVLDLFLKHLPEDGRLILATEIAEFTDQPMKLRQLRNFLVDAILKPMKALGGNTPQATDNESPNSAAGEEIDSTTPGIVGPSRSDQGALKARCLNRDGFRCPVSGLYDYISVDKGLVDPPDEEMSMMTQCAHVLPFALREVGETDERQSRNAATIWYALHHYFPCLRDVIGPNTINQESNAITLNAHNRGVFGMFQLCLEPIEEGPENTYRLHRFGRSGCMRTPFPMPDTITLTSKNSDVPLPNPDFFDVHYRIAKILDVSGIGRKISEAESTELELSRPAALAADGSTDLQSILSRKFLIGI